MMSGEHFLSNDQKEKKVLEKKREVKDAKKQQKNVEKAKLFEAPAEDLPEPPKKKQKKSEDKKEKSSKPDIDDLKNKFLKKKKCF